MNNKDSSKQMLIIGLVILGLNIFSVAGTYIQQGANIISATATSIGANVFVIIGGLLCYFSYKNKGSLYEKKEPLNKKKNDDKNVIKHEMSEEEKKLARTDKIILIIFSVFICALLIVIYLLDI